MIRRLIGPLPHWAEASHPLLRYELNRRQAAASTRVRIARIVSVVLLLALLGIGGYLWATDGLQSAPGINPADAVWRVLLFPTLIVQSVLLGIAFSLGISAVNDERRRQTWDTLRATYKGAGLALRTRWVAVFYRLRGPLLLLVLVRVALIGVVMYQLASHHGAYLGILTANVVPETALVLGLILLGAGVSAAFLLPFTSLGVAAAVGLLISAAIPQRTLAGLLQILLLAARVAVSVGLLWALTQLLAGELIVPEGIRWLLMAATSAFADWGYTLMHLGVAGELWALVPFGVYVGVALLGLALFQSVLADALLALAVRIAERRE